MDYTVLEEKLGYYGFQRFLAAQRTTWSTTERQSDRVHSLFTNLKFSQQPLKFLAPLLTLELSLIT